MAFSAADREALIKIRTQLEDKGIQEVIKALKEIKTSSESTAKGMDTLNKSANSMRRYLSDVKKSLSDITVSSEKSASTLQALGVVIGRVTQDMTQSATAIKAQGTAAGTAAASVGELTQAETALAASTSAQGAATSQATQKIQELKKSTQQTGVAVGGFADTLGKVGSTIRQVGQGLSNLGLMMTMLISAPVGLALKGIADTALDLDEALKGVGKTTGLTGSALAGLGRNLREMATNTATSVVDLAKIAEEVGRIGIHAPAAISEMTRVVNMMVTALDMGVEDTVRTFGKMVAIFRLPVDEMEKFGSVVNKLADTTPVAADQILEALTKVAPAASALGLSAAQVAAFSTTMVMLSDSASRAGTRLRVFFEQMLVNADKVAQFYGPSYWKDLAEAPVETLLDIIERFASLTGEIDEGMGMFDQYSYAIELFGATGTNALMRLVQGASSLRTNLDTANDEWERGTSLLLEYERAMSAGRKQLSLFQNNLTELGLILADAFLPFINIFVKQVIPYIKGFADYLKGASDSTKLWIVGIAALVAALGPMLFIVGNLMFSFGIMATGISTTLAAIVPIIATIGSSLGAIIPILAGIGLVLMGSIGIVITAMGDMAEEIRASIINLIDKAAEWGEGLIGEFAAGIISGVLTFLVNALFFVADTISDFVAAFSAPKKGPLHNIGDWGANLITEYFRGFKNADFSILEKATAKIASYFRNLSKVGLISPAAAEGTILSFRYAFAEIIANFRKTGEVSKSLYNQMIASLGNVGAYMREYIDLLLEEAKIKEKLAGFDKERREVGDWYQEQVDLIRERTDLTDEQKKAMIAALYAEGEERMNVIDQEEYEAKIYEQTIEDKLSWQEGFMKALQETDDIYASLKAAIEKMASAATSAASAAISAAKGREKAERDIIQEIKDEIKIEKEKQALFEANGMDIEKTLSRQLTLYDNLITAMLEAGMTTEEMQPYIDAMQDVQTELDKIREKKKEAFDIPEVDSPEGITPWTEAIGELAKAWEEATTSAAGFKTMLDKIGLAIQSFWAGLTGQPVPGLEEGGPDRGPPGPLAPRGVSGPMAPGARTGAYDIKAYGFGVAMKGVIDTFKEFIAELQSTFKEDKTPDVITDWGDEIKGALIAAGITGAVLWILTTIKTAMASFIASTMLASATTAGAAGGILSSLLSIATGAGAVIVVAALLGAAWSGNWGDIQGKTAAAVGFIGDRLGDLGEWLEGAGEAVGKFLGELGESDAWQTIEDGIGDIGDKFGELGESVEEAWAKISPELSEAGETIGGLMGEIGVSFGSAMGEIGEATEPARKALGDLLGDIGEGIEGPLQGLVDIIGTDLDAAFSTIIAAIETAIDFFRIFLALASGDTKKAGDILGDIGERWGGVAGKWGDLGGEIGGWLGGGAIGGAMGGAGEWIGEQFAPREAPSWEGTTISAPDIGPWQTFANTIGDILGNIGQTVGDFFGGLGETITTRATEGWIAVTGWITTTATDFTTRVTTEWIPAITDWVTNSLPMMITNFGLWLVGLWGQITIGTENLLIKVGTLKDALVDWITDTIPTMVTNMGTFATDLFTEVTNAATNLLEEAKKLGTSLIDGIKAGIEEKWGELTAKLDEVASKVPDWLKGLWGISSPSTVTMSLGKELLAGLSTGLEEQDNIWQEMYNAFVLMMADMLIDWTTKLGEMLTILTTTKDSMVTAFQDLKDKASELIKAVNDLFIDMAEYTDDAIERAEELFGIWREMKRWTENNPIKVYISEYVTRYVRELAWPDGTGAAHGFSGWVHGPTMFLAGEAGPEFVQITPQGEMSRFTDNIATGMETYRHESIEKKATGDTYIIKVENPVIRDDADIDKLADKIFSKLGRRAGGHMSLGGI